MVELWGDAVTTTTAPAPVSAGCRRLCVGESSTPVEVAAVIADAIREEGTVEIEAIGAGALQQAVEGIATARAQLSHDGREIAVAPSMAYDDTEEAPGPVLRLRVLRATLSAGQLHELLRAELEDLVGGDASCLDAVADRLTAAVLVGGRP